MTNFFDAFTRIGPRPNGHRHHPWTLDHLTAELEHCSISGALVSDTMQVQYDAMHENLRLCEKLSRYDHLFPIWNVFPHWTEECPAPDVLTQMMQEHGVRAVTLYPKTNNYSILSGTTTPLLEALAHTRTLTIVEGGAEITFDELETISQRHPELPILVTKCWWSMQRCLWPLILRYPNLHVCFTDMQANRALEWLVEKGCEDQLLFASNAPEMSAGAHRAYLDWSDLPDPVKQKVASGNLARILDGPAPPQEASNAQEDELMAETRRGEPVSCLTLDMHAHMLNEGLNGAGGGYMMFNGGPDGQHELGRRMGVDGIGIMSWEGTVGVNAEQGNQTVAEALDAYPEFYWGLATFDVIHDSPEDMVRQMEARFSDPRFVGLKPYPRYGIPYDDSRYDCWWEFGNQRGLYAGFHPVHWYKPGEFASVCERFPNLTVVAYHCGASYEIADTVIELAQTYPNFMIEPTLTPVCGGVIDYLVEGAGADRVMYGSDQPMRDPRQQLGWIVFSRLDLETKKRVLGGNAQALLEKVNWPASKCEA